MMEDACCKLAPIIGERATRLYQAWLVEDRHGRVELEQMAQALLYKHVLGPLSKRVIALPPPPQGRVDGSFPIGVVHYDGQDFGGFGLFAQEMMAHMLIAGMSGSGKSTLLARIILDHLAQSRPVWAFDFKRDYRSLLSKTKGLRVFTVGRDVAPLLLNPLIPPPGVTPEQWDSVLIESITHAYFAGEGVEHLLYKAIAQAREHVRERAPLLRDVLAIAQRMPTRGRAAQWHDSTLRALHSLCRGNIGNQLNATHPSNLAELMEQSIIFEMDALDTPTRTFLAQLLIMYVIMYRLANNQRGVWRQTIITDEAHNLFLARQNHHARRESHLETALRTARDSGTSLILADQCPAMLSHTVLANTHTTVALNLKYEPDIKTTSNTLLLNQRTGEHHYLSQLPTGHAIVRIANRHHKPFLIRIPNLHLDKTTITDAHVSEHDRSGRIPADSTPTSKNKDHQTNPQEQLQLKRADSADSTTQNSSQGKRAANKALLQTDKITSNARALLHDLKNYPHDSLTKRYARLGLSARAGTKATRELEHAKLVTKTTIQHGNARLAILTPTTTKPPSHGGPEHTYWIHHTKTLLERAGWTTSIEHPIPGGRIDILATKNNTKIPIEIETGKSNWQANIKRLQQNGYKQAIIIATNQDTFDRINKTLTTLNVELQIRIIRFHRKYNRRA